MIRRAGQGRLPIFGGNLLESSRNLIGYLSATAFMRRGRPQRGKLVAVHPRLSLTGIKADEWVPIRPGTYVALALGMANVIIAENLYDSAFVADWSVGFEEYKSYVQQFTPKQTEAITGVPAHLIQDAARMFASSKASSIMTSASPTVHHTNGVQNHRAIIMLSGLTGNFDAPGGNYIVPETWIHVNTAYNSRRTARRER